MHFSNDSALIGPETRSSGALSSGQKIRDHLSVAATLQPHPHAGDSEAMMASLLSRFSAADFDPDNVSFPDETQGVYTDIAIAEYQLRVYAMVHSASPSLSLFLILGSLKGSYLPMGSRLTVSEQNLLLSEQALHWTEHSTYLYTQVFGNWEEKFTIEIVLPHKHPKVLAPLTFGETRSLSPKQDRLAA